VSRGRFDTPQQPFRGHHSCQRGSRQRDIADDDDDDDDDGADILSPGDHHRRRTRGRARAIAADEKRTPKEK
jgi:hypothetical protein